MNAENIVRQVRVLWRTDRIVAELKLRQLAIGMGLSALAALIATFGLLSLELAAYFALVRILSAIASAALLGLGNFVIAAAIFIVASRPFSSRELTLATEVHNSAIDALQQEFKSYRSWDVLATLMPIVTPLVVGAIKRAKKQPSQS